MRRSWNSTCWVWGLLILFSYPAAFASPPPVVALQEDGSLVISDSKGAIAEFVKQGTPRQSVEIGAQNCNVSYGFNSAGKKTILVTVPRAGTAPVVFDLGQNRITVPPGSALRITLGTDNRVEKMDGNPQESVTFQSIESVSAKAPAESPAELQAIPQDLGLVFAETPPSTPRKIPAAPEQGSPVLDTPSGLQTPVSSPPGPLETSDSAQSGWPGRLLQRPLKESELEEERFYVTTDFGARFVSPMSIVNVVGPNGPSNPIIQKQIAFSTGYRQDINVGVWLTDWFGLALETGFALNAIRGNTQDLTVESSTYWSVPILAQLCFQYPNETGWVPFINFGFGGGWNFFNLGTITYLGFTQNSVGLGNDMNTAYQLSAGIRYRIYEEFSMSLMYKFYGTSQPTIDTTDSQQITFGSPVTNSVELGLNFAF